MNMWDELLLCSNEKFIRRTKTATTEMSVRVGAANSKMNDDECK